MNSGRKSVAIPSNSEFISNKEISDRVYLWFLLYGSYEEKEIYMNKNRNGGAGIIDIHPRTFKSKVSTLIENNYIEDYSEKRYKVAKVQSYKRYIYRDIAEKLFETKIDNIIKVYIILSSMYAQYKDASWFTYSSLLSQIGLSYKNQTKNQQKMKEIVDKLIEMNLLKCSRIYNTEVKYMIKFKILGVG